MSEDTIMHIGITRYPMIAFGLHERILFLAEVKVRDLRSQIDISLHENKILAAKLARAMEARKERKRTP